MIGRSLGVSRCAVIARYHRIIRHTFPSDQVPGRQTQAHRALAAQRKAARAAEKRRRQTVAATLKKRGLSKKDIAELMHLPVGRVYRALHASNDA